MPHLRARLSLGPTAARFLRDNSARSLLRAGNRAGKTYVGSIRAWDHVLGAPGRTLLVLPADHTAKIQVIGKQLYELAPTSHLVGSDFDLRRGWRNDLIELRNGSRILFRSGEGAAKAVAGVEATGGWFDEPPSSIVLDELLARVAVSQGPVWGTLTPIGVNARPLQLRVEGDPAAGRPPGETWQQYVLPLTAEECPWRTPESIAAQLDGLAPWARAQRGEGGWEGETVDRVFTGFTEESVVAAVPQRSWQVLIGIDHGELAGHEVAVLVLWDPQTPQMIILDEYVNATRSDPDADVLGIREMLARHELAPRHVDNIVGDTNSAGKTAGGRTINDLMADLLGVPVHPAAKGPGSVDAGVSLLDLAMRRGLLRVHQRCVLLIRSLRHWAGADDDLKHPIDALRYVATEPLQDAMRPPSWLVALP